MMCKGCDYMAILAGSGVEFTAHRLGVLEVIGNSSSPVSAQEIFETLSRNDTLNKVTVYRILDLLVEKNIVERLSSGGRSFLYGMAANENHPRHPHFHCVRCGRVECLDPETISDMGERFQNAVPGTVRKIEINIEGVCTRCLSKGK